MSKIPRDPAVDSTLALLNEGYDFIWNRCRRFQSDVFQARLMGKTTVCIHGREAAELFYDSSKFQRKGAIPRRVVTSLFGKRAVQTLDDDAHRRRKAAFLTIMTPSHLERLMDETAREWRVAIGRWEQADSIVLFDEVQRLLTRATCTWAGVALTEEEVLERARELGQLVDGFAAAGPRLWRAKLARSRTERWMSGIVDEVRRGKRSAPAGSVLQVMAEHRDRDGKLLSTRTAAVEVLNVIRPTVAVCWYITFAALALHDYPEVRGRLASEDAAGRFERYADLVMQEVRRFYPFTPFVGAKVRAPFTWRGHSFRPGTLVLLDVHGAQHDPALWDAAHEFRPERFEQWGGSAFDFIPQGGGERRSGHRCPGEWITMHNITLALHFLTRGVTYAVVPEQDLTYDLSRIPTRPRSGFVVRHVRRTPALDRAAPRPPSPTAARDNAAAETTGEVGPAALQPDATVS